MGYIETQINSLKRLTVILFSSKPQHSNSYPNIYTGPNTVAKTYSHSSSIKSHSAVAPTYDLVWANIRPLLKTAKRRLKTENENKFRISDGLWSITYVGDLLTILKSIIHRFDHPSGR